VPNKAQRKHLFSLLLIEVHGAERVERTPLQYPNFDKNINVKCGINSINILIIT
jgi:hypothetical protein